MPDGETVVSHFPAERSTSMECIVTNLSSVEKLGNEEEAWILKAEKELQEKSKWRDRDVQALRDMVEAEEDLHSRTDDAFLLRFLRARKFDYDRAFQLLLKYYLMQAKNPELFSHMRPSQLKHVFCQQLQTVLEHRDQEGRRVFVFRAGKWNINMCSLEDIFRANILFLEHMIKEPHTQVAGIVAIIDMSGFGLHHLRHFTPAYARKFISVIQNSFPARFKGFHFVNEPLLFNMAFSIVRPFLNEKIRKRLYFHGVDFTSLHKHVESSILPVEFGGSQPKFSNQVWMDGLLACESSFVEEQNYGFSASGATRTAANQSQDIVTYYKKLCIE